MFYLGEFGLDRKDQHVGLANQQYSATPTKDFTETLFVHHSYLKPRWMKWIFRPV